MYSYQPNKADIMDSAIGLIRVYMKHGVVSETTLTHLFMYFFKCYPALTMEQRMDLFIDITSMCIPDDYPNTWIDLDFPTDDEGVAIHPRFK